MRFFDREKEIKTLREIRKVSKKASQFTVLTGRRRIGKTSLVFHAYEEKDFLYFFVARNSEKELAVGFAKEIETKLSIPLIGNPTKFADVFEFVLKIATERNITLFIDEFQDFLLINPTVFSEMQKLWDLYKDKARINLIVAGSVNSLINKIFLDNKEPLYQRMTRMIKVKPFSTQVIKEILSFYSPGYNNEDLLALYSFTGGVAKYIELFMDNEAFTCDRMIDFMINESSSFIEEGRTLLSGEFGKEYGKYFSILSALAQGYTTRSRIEEKVGGECGGYLSRLEAGLGVIGKKQPLCEKTTNKRMHYTLTDNFLTFWFRFIYKYSYLVEINNYRYLREIINKDYSVFSGIMLERYFRETLIEEEKYSRLGSWWDRKGEYEIDIIGIDEFQEKIDFYEVKRNPQKIDLGILRMKAQKFFEKNPDYRHFTQNYIGLSLEDM